MAETMRGLALFGERRAEVRDFPVPVPGPGDVRIRIRSAGICGSDLHFYRDTPEGLGTRRGVVIGHEPSGIVDRTGPGTRFLAPGDRVAVNHTLGCGHCAYCRAGETVHCEEMVGMAMAGRGADAAFVVMPEASCHVLPPALSFAEGSFISCTGATAFGAMTKLAPRGGETVAVFGLGPVGLSTALVARAMGARVIGIDVTAERLAFAADLGFTETMDAGPADAAAAIIRATGRGADCTVETSGSIGGQRAAVHALRAKGMAVFVGVGAAESSISPEDFIHGEKVLMGSKVLSSPGVEEMIRFMLETGLRFEPLVTDASPLEEGPRSFQRFDAGAAGKFLLAPED